MRQQKYLNVILTVNAILLAGLLWTQVADRPVLSDEATAQSRTQPRQPGVGIPNAAQQRMEMVDGIEDLKKAMAAQYRLLKSGELTVRVSNLDEIEIEASD
jgi:hypothetical protein